MHYTKYSNIHQNGDLHKHIFLCDDQKKRDQ